MKYRLVEPYDPNVDDLTPTTRLAITPSGHKHFEMAFNEPVYVEQMALTTAIRSDDVVRGVRALLDQKMGGAEWDSLRRRFANYCLEEDVQLMNFPTHSDYQSQRQLRREFARWLR